MEYKKIINLLDNTPDQLYKCRTKKWIEINDQSRGVYSTGSDIRFKTTMLKPSLCEYGDAYILVKGTITITGVVDDAAERQGNEINESVLFKNCAPFTYCQSEINK